MSSSELCWLSIADASELIASGELSPVELVDAHLERIDQTDGALNSFITVMAEQAADEARAAEDAVRSGGRIGPLHGIPVGLKDLYYTRGVRTGIGSKHTRRLRAGLRRGCYRELPGRGGGADGQAPDARVRAGGVQREPPRRRRPQPVGHLPDNRRLQRRLRLVGRVRPVYGRARQRHRRLDSHTLVVLRHSGAEAHVRARKPPRSLPARFQPGHGGADDAHGAGRRPRAQRHRGPRPARPLVGRQARGGLSRRGYRAASRACAWDCPRNTSTTSSTPRLRRP